MRIADLCRLEACCGELPCLRIETCDSRLHSDIETLNPIVQNLKAMLWSGFQESASSPRPDTEANMSSKIRNGESWIACCRSINSPPKASPLLVGMTHTKGAFGRIGAGVESVGVPLPSGEAETEPSKEVISIRIAPYCAGQSQIAFHMKVDSGSAATPALHTDARIIDPLQLFDGR